MAKINASDINSYIREIGTHKSKLNNGKKAAKEWVRDSLKWIISSKIKDVFGEKDNFLWYSENNLSVIEELKNTLNNLVIPADWDVTYWDLRTSLEDSKKIVDKMLIHLQSVQDQLNAIEWPTEAPIIRIWKNESIDLTKYFESSYIDDLKLTAGSIWDKSMRIKTKSGKTRPLQRKTGSWEVIDINSTDKKLNLKVDKINLPGSLDSIKDYPLEIELDFFVPKTAGGAPDSVAQVQTQKKIKIFIKEPTDVGSVLLEEFFPGKSYWEALNERLDSYYNTNLNKVVKEYIKERIDKSGWSLSDNQKEILMDFIINDDSFLDGDLNKAYTLSSLQWDFPQEVEKNSVWKEGWYKDDIRKLLISSDNFDKKTKEIIKKKLESQKKTHPYLADENIFSEVSKFLNEQSLNSVWNITNNMLPTLFSEFSNKWDVNIRHQNKQKTWYRNSFKNFFKIFSKERKKITDISTNNYFSFFSGNKFDMKDNIDLAGKKVTQNVSVDIKNRNHINANIKTEGDEKIDLEFVWASSIYELITGIMLNKKIWAVNKLYIVFNLYKSFFTKMKEMFGDQDINIWWNVFKISAWDKLNVKVNGKTIFDEDGFRKKEHAGHLQSDISLLARSFNKVMTHQNNNYIKWMTRDSQNKFQIGNKFMRKNLNFNFKTKVDDVDIEYKDKKFYVKKWDEVIRANKIETILSHKAFEWQQIQIMQAIYRSLIETTVDDTKAKHFLEKHHGIGFVVPYKWKKYVVRKDWDKLKFGIIPPWFPPENIDTKNGILKTGMYTPFWEKEVIWNPELASVFVNSLKRYRGKVVFWLKK